jgi:hypothetical protein
MGAKLMIQPLSASGEFQNEEILKDQIQAIRFPFEKIAAPHLRAHPWHRAG